MLLDNGIWESRTLPTVTAKRAGLLLDRDGVVVKEVQYLGRPQDVRLEHGIEAVLDWMASQRVPVAVTTNQAGIARGLYGWAEFEAVETEIARQLGPHAAAVEYTIACPFHPDFTPGYSEKLAYWRKPGPGMLLRAIEQLNLDAPSSWMIGDKASDIAAARAAGLRQAIHVLSGHGRSERTAALEIASGTFRVVEAADNIEALAVLRESICRS